MIGEGFESGFQGFAGALGRMAVDRQQQRAAEREAQELARIQALADARATARIRAEFLKLLRENADLRSRLVAQTDRANAAERGLQTKRAASRRLS